MSTGRGIDCLYGATYAQNVYYAGNTIALCHGWERAAMTTDAGGGAYYGPVAEAVAGSLVIPEKGNWRGSERWKGGGVFILSGLA